MFSACHFKVFIFDAWYCTKTTNALPLNRYFVVASMIVLLWTGLNVSRYFLLHVPNQHIEWKYLSPELISSFRNKHQQSLQNMSLPNRHFRSLFVTTCPKYPFPWKTQFNFLHFHVLRSQFFSHYPSLYCLVSKSVHWRALERISGSHSMAKAQKTDLWLWKLFVMEQKKITRNTPSPFQKCQKRFQTTAQTKKLRIYQPSCEHRWKEMS